MIQIPKPILVSADETSLVLRIEFANDPPKSTTVKLQYKEPKEPWELAKEVTVKKPLRDIINLKPGTPYFVRISLETKDGTEFGEEGVFDTAPVGCAPKRKNNCIIA